MEPPPHTRLPPRMTRRPAARSTLARTPWRAIALLATLATCVEAHALDVATGEFPLALADHAARIGQRTLALPEGTWTLIGRNRRTFTTPRGEVNGITAWIAGQSGTGLTAVVVLSLLDADMPQSNNWLDGKCAVNEDILKDDRSRGIHLPECLAILGHADVQTEYAPQAPRAMNWLRAHAAEASRTMVEFRYSERSLSTVGAVSIFLPTADFEEDAKARDWARGLRAAFQPFFEGRQQSLALPVLPQPPAAP